MTSASQQIFGRRKAPHTIIFARGETVRHFTVQPWLARTIGLLSAGAAIAVVGSTALLVSGGNWNSFAEDGEPDLATRYELRIATLRSEVDRLTTRGFLDRERVSSKVDVLLDQQAQLSQRYAKLQPLLDRARAAGLIDTPVPVPVPKPNPQQAATPTESAPLAYTDSEGPEALRRFRLVDPTGGRKPASAAAAPGMEAVPLDLLRQVGESIDDAENGQIEGLNLLASRAKAKSDAIGDVLRAEGVGRLKLPVHAAGGEGGPFVPVPPGQRFDAGLLDLAAALDSLQAVRDASAALPLAAPVPSTAISSTFGVREDPFFGRAAMHTGIDFVEQTGTAVKATAPGKVVFAGENAGYGQMVEIDHGNGLSTRYAHMSSIAVEVGQAVVAGTAVGRVGSTGRSTGPHLHYEVRRAGEAIDPSRFLKAGRRISALG
ncbi:M23 family metallopeptidase [Aureimonas leprariae]|uniref:M23 family metallopeptidase n=1 Tax=Plantimonas leprariae TaxID=2615207 RepID=A0A7V7PS30_9HYPH|nr:M23 family metallopeptidase [Aureimonas leprariae]KAB0681817.1 M23 family metallopeptidase [Aureimonas leprariae]